MGAFGWNAATRGDLPSFLSYQDRSGKQCRKQFSHKRLADHDRTRIENEIALGIHIPDGESLSVRFATGAFLADFSNLVDLGRREKSTLYSYEQHIRLHINTRAIAEIRLSRLTAPDCTDFISELEGILSEAMSGKVLTTLKSVLNFSQIKGWISASPAGSISIRSGGVRSKPTQRVFPEKEQLRSLLDEARATNDNDRTHAMISLLLFGGLRISELRGLRKTDIQFDQLRVNIQQRADRWQKIGSVKSDAGFRSVPLPEGTITALKRCVVASPNSPLNLAFPNGAGNVESYANIYNRIWCPLMLASGLATTRITEKGTQRITPDFGIHTLRHSCVSLWIESTATPKQVMTWAGHASIQFTMDVYGHLWDDPALEQQIVASIARAFLK